MPLNFLANEDFKGFLAAIRPKFVVPNRHRSQKQIVTKIYDKEKLVVDRSIKNASNVAISTDGWKDINKHHMMNFVVHTPTEWLHSFQPETSGEASFISDKIVELVEEIGSEKVTALVSDHAANVVAAGKIVSEKFPWIKHSGCQCHGLNLGCKDICKTKTFHHMNEKCTSIFGFFKFVLISFFCRQKSIFPGINMLMEPYQKRLIIKKQNQESCKSRYQQDFQPITLQ